MIICSNDLMENMDILSCLCFYQLQWSPTPDTSFTFLTELCQFPTVQLSYQLPSRQFPTWNYTRPGGGGHPYLHLQHYPRIGEGGREDQRWVVRPVPYNYKASSCPLHSNIIMEIHSGSGKTRFNTNTETCFFFFTLIWSIIRILKCALTVCHMALSPVWD